MKKLSIILITIVFCLPLLSKAQVATGSAPATTSSAPATTVSKTPDKGFKPFSFGLKAIPSLSFVKPNVKDFKNANPTANFGYGLMAEFNFAPNYGFFTGIEINSNGGNIDYIPSVSKVYYLPEGGKDTSRFYLTSMKYTVKYLNIPLLLKLKTNEIGVLKYYGQFGVDAGFRLKSTATYKGTSGDEKPDILIGSEINLIRLGLNIGLGAEYNLSGNTSLVFGLNYNNGFTNFLKKESKYVYVDNGKPAYSDGSPQNPKLTQSAYNSYVALTLGILF